MTAKHGGVRKGAGRRSISKRDRLLIGARCQNEWEALTESASLARHRSQLDYEGIEKSRNILHAVPLKYRNDVSKYAAEPKLKRNSLSPDIADAIEQLHHLIWTELDGPQRKVSFKKPQGERDALIARIAASESKKCGVPISHRQVERWWEEYLDWCKTRDA